MRSKQSQLRVARRQERQPTAAFPADTSATSLRLSVRGGADCLPRARVRACASAKARTSLSLLHRKEFVDCHSQTSPPKLLPFPHPPLHSPRPSRSHCLALTLAHSRSRARAVDLSRTHMHTRESTRHLLSSAAPGSSSDKEECNIFGSKGCFIRQQGHRTGRIRHKEKLWASIMMVFLFLVQV